MNLPETILHDLRYGIRALSQCYLNEPFVLKVHGDEYKVNYLPAESDSGMFGGNSNWRGPVWMPVNFLIIESLRNRMFKVRLDNGHELLGYTSGRMKRYRIRMLLGDRVRIELSPYDLDRGRIVYRLP